MRKTLISKILYWLAVGWGWTISGMFFPLRVRGKENSLVSRNYIFASNHVSNLDPVILGLLCGRPLSFMAKRSLFDNVVLGFVLRNIGAFPLTREGVDVGAIKESLRRLKAGSRLVIFPQGTRVGLGGDPSRVFEAQSGVGFLAVKSAVPVIPVYVHGSDLVLAPKQRWPKRRPVEVIFGKPMIFSKDADYSDVSRQILNAIHDLAPSVN